MPGRTDNEIKNYWRTHFKKKQAKVASDASEKARARLLKRQQFHQQQQLHHQQQQQQQQQQLQLNQIIALLDENEHNKSAQALTQVRQEISTAAFPQTADEQSFFYTMLNVNNNVPVVPEVPINEDILWDGLWNLDDYHGIGTTNFNATCSTTKASSLHNLVVPFC